MVAVISVSTASTLPVFLTGALGVQIRAELHFTPARLGAAATVYFLASALASALFGRVAEGMGSQWSMRWACALSSVSLLLVGLLARSWGALAGFLALGGFANALAQPASNAMIVERVRVGRRALAFGIKQSAIPAATLIGGLSVPLVALTVGWRWAFLGAALAGFLAAFLVPRVEAGRSRERRERVAVGAILPLALLAMAGGLASAAANALGQFVTSSGVDAGLAEATAGYLLALGSAVGLLARIWWGWRADSTALRPLKAVSLMLMGGALGYLLMSTGRPATYVLGTLIGFGLGWSWPGLFNFAVAHGHSHAPAAATGITQTGVYAGGAAGPLVFGLVAQHYSYGAAWMLMAALALGASLAIVLARSSQAP